MFLCRKLSKMHAGIGTHLDTPAHCIPNGTTAEEISVDKLMMLPCVKIDISDKANATYSLAVADIYAFEANYGKCLAEKLVVIYTGWDRFWHKPEQYRNNYIFPSISKEAAELLIERKIAGIGIDTLAPDRPQDDFFVHQLLLSNGKLLIENVANAMLLPVTGSRVIALPLKIHGCTEVPIRLVAVL